MFETQEAYLYFAFVVYKLYHVAKWKEAGLELTL